jgi:ribosomal peptide maturation radical SAM protein 1
MYQIKLINMPFGGIQIPSLGLTQLKARLKRSFPDEVAVEICYLNHHFAHRLGLKLYRFMSDEGITTVTGLTDWLFRQVAFPKLADNVDEYLRRYRHSLRLSENELAELIIMRNNLADFLDRLIAEHELDRADLVGFTSMFDQTVASIAMARRLKARNSAIVTVLGGAACDASAGEVLVRNTGPLDFVFVGPALDSFTRFVTHSLAGEEKLLNEIQGVYSRRNIDSAAGQLGAETDINDRLQLDYDDFLASLKSICAHTEPELLFETSRGCWWGERLHCTFCGLNGTTMKYRRMDPENALAQFSDLFARYPSVRRFFAVDNILDPEYFKSVFPTMTGSPGVSIFYECRIIEDEKQLEVLAKAGVTRIQPGIEALSSEMLKLMGKGSTSFRNIRFLKMVSQHGIEPDWNLLLGFPKERATVYEDYLRSIPSLVHLPPPGAAFPVRFDRFSPYFMRPRDYDLDLKPLDFYAMVYPFTTRELESFAYFFADHNFDNDYLKHLARWQRKIVGLVNDWIARWSGAGKEKPILRYAADGRTVIDTRWDEEQHHILTTEGSRLLLELDQPLTIRRLCAQTGLSELYVLPEIQKLDAQRLLFREGDRMMSLVTQ